MRLRRGLARIFLVAGLVLATAAPAPAAPRLGRETVGFYVPWDPQSQASLALHVNDITVFAPQWINLTGAPGAFNLVADDVAQQILHGAKRPPRIMPLVTNAHDARWDAQAADAVLLDPGVRTAFVTALARTADEHAFSGYVLDFESLSPQGAAAYPALIAALKAALSSRRGAVWVTVPLVADPGAPETVDTAADATVVMAYDQCWITSTPGPVAGLDWLAAGLAARRAAPRPARGVLALGSYAYDWPEGGPAKVLSIGAAEALAQARGAAIVRAQPSMNVTFDYKDDAGRTHHVWMADAKVVADAKARFGAGFAGWGLWRLGLEDPLVWAKPSEAAAALPAAALQPPRCEPSP